jgi:hypothetical protein
MRPALALAALCLTALATPAAAQLVRYECRTAAVEGVSVVESSQRAARRGAEDAWVASARSQHGFAYRWALAQEVRPTQVDSQGSGWVGTARAHPCRVHVERLNQGTLTVNETESDRVCRSFPSLAEARRHGCTFFYPLRR